MGTAQAQTEWNASDGAPLDWFGYAVATQGDWAVAGAPFESEAGARAGAVYVLDQASGVEVKLLPSSSAPGGHFGSAVDLDGDTLVVGAPADGLGGQAPGKAYVFEYLGGSWQQVAQLQGSPGAAGDGLGTSVAVHGDRILVGAPWDATAGIQAGAVWAFRRQAGVWIADGQLAVNQTRPGDFYGYAVALGERWACVGAYSANSVVYNEGAAYLFDHSGGSYAFAARVTEPSPMPNTNFGRSVSLAGDRLAVGATHDSAGLQESGRVTLFRFDGNAWTLEASVQPNLPQAGNAFGFAVSLAGDRLLVGAPLTGGSGAAYLFEPIQGSWYETRSPDFAGTQPGDFVGVSVALGSGWGLVGAMRDASLGWSAGAVQRLDPSGFEAPDAVSFCGCSQGPPCGGTGDPHGCPNGLGHGAVMGIEGSVSIGQDDLVLTMSGMAPGQFGFFWMGDGASEVALYNGYLCVSAGSIGIFRWSVSIAGSDGVLRTGPGLVAASQGLPGALLAGSSWSFQGIYRDPGGACGTGINLSDAIWVTWKP
ncbi:MAG: hypothetical protein H6829_10645 [Planctomycetes bacterium]|nr:hypothetical protein [Planctomycetota bacterium]